MLFASVPVCAMCFQEALDKLNAAQEAFVVKAFKYATEKHNAKARLIAFFCCGVALGLVVLWPACQGRKGHWR